VGVVSDRLYEAILKFQRHHRLSVDGHIDPNGAAIELINRLKDPGTAERFPGNSGIGESTSSSRAKCGPLRTVKSGFLPDLVDVTGGPTGQFKFTNVTSTVTIETNITAPAPFRGIETFTISFAKPFSALKDVGMPPPVHWLINVRAISDAVVRYEFLTDWAPGEPPCDPL
jgi:hypothetical protein